MSIMAGNAERDRVDVITHMNGIVFRVVSVPFDLDGVRIGALYLATAWTISMPMELGTLAGARTAIVSDGQVVASTLSADSARAFETAVASTQPAAGIVTLDGESYAFRRLVEFERRELLRPDVDRQSSRAATRTAVQRLSIIAGGRHAAGAGGELLARTDDHRTDRAAVDIAEAHGRHARGGGRAHAERVEPRDRRCSPTRSTPSSRR